MMDKCEYSLVIRFSKKKKYYNLDGKYEVWHTKEKSPNDFCNPSDLIFKCLSKYELKIWMELNGLKLGKCLIEDPVHSKDEIYVSYYGKTYKLIYK